MNQYQTHSVIGWQGWREFLEARLHDYLVRVCGQPNPARRIRTATLIAPPDCQEADLSTASVADHVFAPTKSDDARWAKQPDAFEAASYFLQDAFSQSSTTRLFCLDQLARPGDPVLESQSHTIYNGLVFHDADIAVSDAKKIAWVLRSGRVLGLSGSICAQSVSEVCDQTFEGKFISDAFNGDLIVVCDL